MDKYKILDPRDSNLEPLSRPGRRQSHLELNVMIGKFKQMLTTRRRLERKKFESDTFLCA
jgi:hypothetical protein